MAQSGGVTKRKCKDIFRRKVVLVMNDNECTSFSDINKIESRSEIEFSSNMTQNDVQKKIQGTFPYLKYKSFSCAAFVKVDNDHKKFEFHGSRRVWDGKTIKKKIKGQSNLYILEKEVAQPTSTVIHDSNSTDKTPSTCTSAHNSTNADHSHQSGGQANNINALLSGEQAVLYQEISELQMLHSEHDEGAMEVEENQQDGASGFTNTGNLEVFHAKGATNLQNSLIPVNVSSLEQGHAVITSQQGFNVMPGCSTDNKYTAAAAPEAQVEKSDCRLSSSDDDDTPTSGISESDLEFSEKSEDSHADARPNSSAGDTGFDEGMDIDHGPHLDAIKNEEDIPFSQHHVISMVAPSRSDDVSDETSDDMVQQDPLEAAVQDTCSMNPKSGSVEGGYPFHMTVTKELPSDLTSAIVRFHSVADVQAGKLDSFTLSGIVPLSLVHGDVQVTAMRDLETSHVLGTTYFKYVDDVLETVEELVKDRFKLYQSFVRWAKESKLLQSDSDISESFDQDSSSQIKQKHQNVLQLLVYTAAQTNAQQFLEMIFSTSAGQIVFNSYKDRTPLPEDIARANGHEDLAHFLQDINTRLSKETSGNVQNNAIDWLELVKAVQKQASAVQDESTTQLNQSENDDNSSDYFADAETSSCGSIDHDTGWSDISEDKGPCIRDGESIQGPTVKPEEGTPNKKPVKKWAQLDNEGDKENVSIWGLTHSFSEWRKREDTSSIQEGKGDGSIEANSASKTPKAKPTVLGSSCFWFFGIWIFLLVIILGALITVTWPGLHQLDPLHVACKNGNLYLVKALIQSGSNVNARNVPGHETPLHLAARYGHQHIANVLIQSGSDVNARNIPRRDTPLHLASENGHKHVAKLLIQRGGNLNAMNDMRQVPLHLTAKNGHKHVAELLIQHGGDVNPEDLRYLTPLHLAAQNGHKHVAELLIQHGGNVNCKQSDIVFMWSFYHWQRSTLLICRGNVIAPIMCVNGRNSLRHFTPLHLAAWNGHKHVVELLIQHGGDVNAGDSLRHFTPLHLAAWNGHKDVAELLIQHGGGVNARDSLRHLTPLHLAAWNGHEQVSVLLIQHGGDVNARYSLWHLTPLHLAAWNGHKQVSEVLIQHGGNVNARVSLWHFTPLHLAAQNGHKQVSEVLIQHGDDVNARSRQEYTPLHIVFAYGHKDIANLLIQHRSNVNALNVPWRSTSLHLAVKNDHNVSAKDSLDQVAIYVAAQHGHKRIVFIQHGNDARQTAFAYANKSEVLIQCGGGTKSQDGAKQSAFDLASESELQLLPEVLMHHGKCIIADINKLFQKRQFGLKPLKVLLEKLKSQSQQVILSDPATWNLLIDVSSEARLGSINRKRHKLGQSPTERRNTCLFYQSNDYDKASNARCLHKICVPCGYYPDRTSLQSPESNLFNSSNRKTGEVLSWHGLVSSFTETSAQDSINIEVLLGDEQVSSYDQQHHLKTLLFVVIVAMCLVMCLMLWYKYKHQVGVRLYRENWEKGGMKEKQSTPGNRYIEASMIELRMERVKSWLDYDLCQEELSSVDGGGVTRNRGSRRNRRKTGEPTEEELLKLSTEFGTKWKQLARALEIREAEIEVVDKENRRVDEKCYHLLMVWKKQRGSLATYEALEAGLRHGAVQRKDLIEKYCLAVVTKRLHKNVNFPKKS